MCNFIIIFILLYIVWKQHNAKIVKHYESGYYLYYEAKVFNVWFKEYNSVVKKILLWKLRREEDSDPY